MIVDDHPMVREGVRSMLGGGEVEVVGETGCGLDAARIVEEASPDVVLLDLELPDLDGLLVLERIKHAAPGTAVLVVTMHGDARLVRRAVEAGASGYVLKGVSRRELLAAIAAVHDGESVVDPALLRALVAAAAAEAARAHDGHEPLTAVEQDVLRLVAEGLTNREIASRVRWSVATVKKYVQRILEKLDAADRTQAAVVAVRRRLV